jgi:translation initiation factor eIF-2B subunit alpha
MTETAKEPTVDSKAAQQVLKDLKRFLQDDETDDDNDNDNNNDNNESPLSLLTMKKPLPVALMQALLAVAQRSKAETMMGLQDELQQATRILMDHVASVCGRVPFSLWSASHLLVQYSTRTFLEWAQFEDCRQVVVERGTRLVEASKAAHLRVVHFARGFLSSRPASAEGLTVLTHGHAHLVDALIEYAATKSPISSKLRIIVLEGRPLGIGVAVAQRYASLYPDVEIQLAVDASIGYWIEQCSMVIVGAEAVLEHGGIVNTVGTFPLAVCAQAAGKPFYVAAESYKMARLPTALYPLNQSDVPHPWVDPLFYDNLAVNNDNKSSADKDKPTASTTSPVSLHPSVRTASPVVDFTPAHYITLLFTDLGVLTPSAVSDELIRLYQ